MSKKDRDRGLYDKYNVDRKDGTHSECPVFVIDLRHDKFGRAVMAIYAKLCKDEYPVLARDLKMLVQSEMDTARDNISESTIQTAVIDGVYYD